MRKNGTAREINRVTDRIGRTQKNDNVLAIPQYGSGAAEEVADTDLCVVVKERPQGQPGLGAVRCGFLLVHDGRPGGRAAVASVEV